MNRCLIFLGSVLLALVAVSTATSAGASDWARASDGGDAHSSWAAAPSVGLLASSFDSF